MTEPTPPRWTPEAITGVTALWLAFVLLSGLLGWMTAYTLYSRTLEHEELMHRARERVTETYTRPIIPRKDTP